MEEKKISEEFAREIVSKLGVEDIVVYVDFDSQLTKIDIEATKRCFYNNKLKDYIEKSREEEIRELLKENYAHNRILLYKELVDILDSKIKQLTNK